MAAVAVVMAAASFLFTTTNTAAEALGYSALFGFGLGGILTVPPVAYADYYGRASLGTIRGITEPFTTFGQAVGVMIPGIVFDTGVGLHQLRELHALLLRHRDRRRPDRHSSPLRNTASPFHSPH